MKDLRVAWLLPTAWFYWQPSLSELAKLFPKTKVFTGLFPGFAKGFENTLDVEVVGERKVVAVTQSSTSYGDSFTYLSPKIVIRLLQYRPHIIFSSSFGVWTILALLLKFIGGWKVIIAYEGSSPGVDYRHSPLRLWLRRAMVWAADACITNSHGGHNYLTHVLGAAKDRVVVQPYEVPDVRSLAAINPTLERVSQENALTFSELHRPVFLFVGQIVPRKGVRHLLEACHLLQQANAGHFSLLIVGDGAERAELQALTQAYQLNEVVTWVGRVDYSDISTYFHHADVFVLPTLEDTWGLVVLEAMLLGKPVLCSKGAGASELILDGENGYCFAPNHPGELAEAMQRLIQHPDQIPAMGQRSQALMHQYRPDVAATRMAELITCVTTPSS